MLRKIHITFFLLEPLAPIMKFPTRAGINFGPNLDLPIYILYI